MTEATEHACIFFSLHVFFSFSHQVVCFIILDSFYTSVLADFLWHRLGRGRGVKTEDRHPSPLPLLTLQGSPSDCWARWEFQYPMWAPAIPLVGLVTDLLGWMSWFPSWPSLPPRQQQSQCILIQSLLRLESRLRTQPSVAAVSVVSFSFVVWLK